MPFPNKLLRSEVEATASEKQYEIHSKLECFSMVFIDFMSEQSIPVVVMVSTVTAILYCM